ncbi:taurocyamine kinase-like [Haliotis cracherodii]|uniref:taurocyamine kinase-like n=1 Tax=Haliotis cracherodii TaxID=6455 RepID=UPI0039E81EBE
MASVEELWAKLDGAADCKSLLKNNLTKERYEALKDKKTKFGGTLADCIRSGCMNLDSGVGIYACDPEAYTVFADVLDAVIKEYHKVPELKHPEPEMGDLDKLNFGDLDPSGEYIVSTRVRVGRSHDSYGFPPVLTKQERLKMEEDTKAAFEKFTGELAGKYFPLEGMSKEDQKQMTEDHFLFKDDDRFLRDAGGYNDWCSGRGIFFNTAKNFLVWVNEEDHLRLISMQKGGDLAAVYKRLVVAINTMTASGLSFAKRDGLGYLTFCPSNLGTALRASVHMKIPNLAASPDFKSFCDNLNIQARGIHGEHTESVGGVYDLSNKRRLGLTEYQAVEEMRVGVEACLAKEKELTGNADLQELWTRLSGASSDTCKSLLKKNLTQARFDALKDKKTKFGGTLADCIRSGCKNLESGVGIYACDPEGYTVFADVLDAVIKDYHKVEKLDHPEPDMGELDKLQFADLDPSGDYILSTRVRVGRSHDSYGFPPVLTKEQRLKMEEDTKAAFEKFTGELAGKYYPLDGMKPEDQKQLVEDHFLFKDDDRFLRDASGYDDWPSGRGIFHNNDKTFLVWVNEEDHLRLISMQKGGDLGAVYRRLVNAITTMQGSGLSFAKRKGLGYLTFCPSNLGTALRASVHMKIPNLAAQPDFKEFCEKLNIQPRGIHGEHTESVGGVYDLSNKRRLGLTEFQAVEEMRAGVEACLKKEKELEAAAKK